MSQWLDFAWIALGAFFAGAVNSVAGGGTFFSFPVLLAVGVPPVIANATNSVALWPASLAGAWAYRHEMARYKAHAVPLAVVALLGGLLGGGLLLLTHDSLFNQLIPWLLLLATGLFALSKPLSRLASRLGGQRQHQFGVAGLLVQGLVSVYGGFFGAGMGILMLASLAIQGIDDVHELNALKNGLSAVVYSVASVTFIVAGSIWWTHTVVMVIAAALGAYLGVVVARRIPANWLRAGIVLVGLILTGVYFNKIYLA
ncbi:sulfite exporter TauE/SafE family protein [Limnobacter humi]|uniref:Probable membrane transporter protein n=1 Tax=Limnobacter humi TaxID=1778671 RepID=A0ABT1WIG9_9BURK|nr:sulfite exporter TauE/SafE family protein [Limnobacter humi]MCQ8897317.1 sulfite exporter TauE/SafE family protein [Limnobacter humi]